MGRRVKYKSCNTQGCHHPKMSFREQQCAGFNGRHFNINGLPPGVTWEPKYDGSKSHLVTIYRFYAELRHLCATGTS